MFFPLPAETENEEITEGYIECEDEADSDGKFECTYYMSNGDSSSKTCNGN